MIKVVGCIGTVLAHRVIIFEPERQARALKPEQQLPTPNIGTFSSQKPSPQFAIGIGCVITAEKRVPVTQQPIGGFNVKWRLKFVWFRQSKRDGIAMPTIPIRFWFEPTLVNLSIGKYSLVVFTQHFKGIEGSFRVIQNP